MRREEEEKSRGAERRGEVRGEERRGGEGRRGGEEREER